jgi:hypothetical protein
MWERKVDVTAFATHFFFLVLHRQTPLFLSLMSSFIHSKPPTVSFKTLDRCVTLAEKRFELQTGCLCGSELTLKDHLRKCRI